MTTKELSKILTLKSCFKIGCALALKGYTDCKSDKKLQKASLYDICIADRECATSSFAPHNREYMGEIYRGVKGFDEYEFVVVELLGPVKPGSETIFTQKILIYAKKIRKSDE